MAEDTEFRQIWANAFDIYKKKTGRDIKHDSVLRNLSSTKDLLAEINDEEQKFSDFRKKKEKLFSVLSATMKPVELRGGLTQDTLTLTPFSPCSQILEAALFLVRSARGVSSAYDCIANLLGQLGAFTARLEEYTKAAVDSKLRKKVTDILTTLLEILARSEKLIRQGRIEQYLRVTFLGNNAKVAAAMSRLKELMDTEEKLVVSLTYSTTQRMDKTVERTERGVERNEQTLDGIVGSLNESRKDSKEQAENKKEDAEQKLINKTLDSDAVREIRKIYGNVSEQILEGSGEWIKEENLFKDWLTKKTPLLWILGNPGAGKSYLSSRIISHLQELNPQDPKHPSRVSLGYFYIKEDNQYLRSLTTILRTLAFQIQSNDSVYKKYVANVCKSSDEITTAKSLWKRYFIDFFGALQYRDSSTLLVIDGLDEAPTQERKTLIELLSDLEDIPDQNSRPRIQIVLFGRPELHDDINYVWGKKISFIEVSARKNSRDITNYITKGLKGVRALRNKHIETKERVKLHNEIVEKIAKGANGMFLWVDLMFHQINNKSRPSDISKALDNAPPKVSEMIRQAFERLSGDPDAGNDLNEMLIWVTCARRPLLLGELDAIMKLIPPVGEGLPDLEELLRLKFASFFILEREDGLTTEDLQQHARHTHTDQKLPTEGENVEDEDLDGDLNPSESFESDFGTTSVKFSHASIRDYLVQEGRPKTRKYSKIKVSIDMARAEQHIATTCLSVLCSSGFKTDEEVASLVKYAADHFLEHLILLDKATMSQEDKQMVLRPLFQLFSDDLIIKAWLNNVSNVNGTLIQMLLVNTKFSARVREWFGDIDAFGDSFTPEERAAMQKMAKSDKEILRPLARYCALMWLTEKERQEDGVWFFGGWFQFLHGCVTIDDFAKKDEDGKRIGFDRFLWQEISVSKIRKLAHFIDLEKNAHWHARLATALRENNHLDAAIREYHISIGLDEQGWSAKLDLAECYEQRQDYTLAIDWARNSLTGIPDNQKDIKSTHWHMISRWKLEIGDIEGEIEASRETCKLNPEGIVAAVGNLSALEAGGRFQEMVEFAESLEKLRSAIVEESFLTEMLLFGGGDEELGNAAKALGRLEFVSNAIETSIAAAERKKFSWPVAYQRYRFGCFKFKWLQNTDEAMELWELVLESTADTKKLDQSSGTRRNSTDQLSQLYFDRAIKSEKKGLSSDPWISKLDRLSRQIKGSEGDDDVFSMGAASMVLGLWYRLHNKHDKAKVCFTPQTLEAIDLLTDDDPENDRWGYCKLALVLLMAGDKVNASPAFAFTTTGIDIKKDARQAMQRKIAMRAVKESPTEDKQCKKVTLGVEMNSLIIGAGPDDAMAITDTIAAPALMVETTTRPFNQICNNADDNSPVPSNNAEIEESKSGDLTQSNQWGCDGICKSKEEAWTAFYICEFCWQIGFCDQCVELVRTDRLPFRICSSSHPFYQIWPNAQKMTDMNTVVVDGKTLPRTEWLANLRKEWEG